MDRAVAKPPVAAGGLSERASEFVTDFDEAFAEAVRVVGALDRELVIGGRRVRLRFAGEALLPFVEPALAHPHVSRSAAPDLTIAVWDTASTGVARPASPWSARDVRERGEIVGHGDEAVRIVYHGDAGGFDAFSLFDLEARSGLF